MPVKKEKQMPVHPIEDSQLIRMERTFGSYGGMPIVLIHRGNEYHDTIGCPQAGDLDAGKFTSVLTKGKYATFEEAVLASLKYTPSR